MIIAVEDGSLVKPLFILSAVAIGFLAYRFLKQRRVKWFEQLAFDYGLTFETFDLSINDMAVNPEIDAFFKTTDTRYGFQFLVSGTYRGVSVYVTDIETAEDGSAENTYTAIILNSPRLDLPEFHMSPQGRLKSFLRGTNGIKIPGDMTFTHHTHLVTADEEKLVPCLSEEFRLRFRKEHSTTIEGHGNMISLSKFPNTLSMDEIREFLDLAPDLVDELSTR